MAIRTDFAPGEVLAAGDLNDTFGAKLNLAGGKILQVVSTTKTDTFSMNSTTYADVTGLSVTITPQSTASKILVMSTINVGGLPSGTAQFALQLVRNSTAIGIGDAAGSRTRATSAGAMVADFTMQNVGITFLDSPASISATTYKIQIRSTAVQLMYVNRPHDNTDNAIFPRTASNITVMEVSA